MQYVALSGGGALAGGEFSDGNVGVMLLGSLAFPSLKAGKDILMEKSVNVKRLAKVLSTQEGHALAALDEILRHADKPEEVAEKLRIAILNNEGKPLNQSLGMVTGDAGIIGFEKSQSKYKNAFKELDETGVQLLSEGLKDIVNQGSPEITRNLITQLRDAQLAEIQANVNAAKKHVEYSLDVAGTAKDVGSASKVLDDAFSIAFNNAKAIEQQAWNGVKKGERIINIASLEKQFDTMIKETFTTKTALRDYKKSFEDDINTFKSLLSDNKKSVKKLGSLDGGIDIQELLDLRSSILDKLRNLPKENRNNFNKKFGSDFQALVLETIKQNSDSEAYEAASQITKKLHSIFDKSYFSKGEDIAELVADKTFIKGPKGGVSANQLLNAAGYGENGIIKATEDVIKSAFARVAIKKDGTLDLNNATKFLNDQNYGEFLRKPEFRQVRSLLEDVVESGEAQDLALLNQRASKAKIEKSIFHLYAESKNPHEAIASIISNRAIDPVAAIRDLKKAVAQDKSGDALRGLQQAFLDELSIDGTVVKYKSKERRHIQPLLKEIFTEDQVERIDKIFKQVDKIRSRPGYTANVEKDDALIMSTLGKIIGTGVGKQFGQSPLIMAGVGSRVFQKLMKDLPQEAISDITNKMLLNPELFEQYAKQAAKVKTPEEAVPILHQWLLISGHQSALQLTNPNESY